MKLTDLFGLYTAIKGREADFKASAVGDTVALEFYQARIFGGLWLINLRRVR